jgi:hypothetical protein
MVSPALRSSANMVHIGGWSSHKSDIYDSRLKTMLTLFLSIDNAIWINWPTPGEKLNRGYFCETILEPLTEILHGERAAGSPRPIAHFDDAMSHRSAATEIAFNFANSDMLPSYPTARISVHVSFFYPMIWKGNLRVKKEELQARFDELLGLLTPETMRWV